MNNSMNRYRVSINVNEFARPSVSKMSQPGSGSIDVKLAESPAKKNGKVQESVKRESSQCSLIHSSLVTVDKLKPEGDLPSEAESSRYDCCAYIIHCGEHDQVLLTRQNDIWWMPYTYLPPNRSWEDSAVVGFCRVLAGPGNTQYETLLHSPPYQTFRCLQLNRLQVPQTFKFIKRITLYFKLKPSSESFKCCQATSPHLVWLPMKSITGQTVVNLWGPELVEFCRLVSSTDWKPSRCKITEFGLEEAFSYLPRKPACNLEQHMLNLTAITSTEVERLYEDYIDFCFPSYCMSPYAFNQFMAHEFSFETNPSRLEALFRAFNYTNSGWLSFPELLMGLVCFEPNSYHGEVQPKSLTTLYSLTTLLFLSLQYRTKFIFRYWDTQQTGRLTKEQLKAILLEINPGTDVESKLKQLATMGGGTSEITEEAFTRAVGSLKFRGTSALCRSSKPIFSTLRMAIACKHYTYSKKTINSIKAALGCVLVNRKHKEPCPTCMEKKYDLACHIAHLDSSVKNSLKRCERLPQVQVPKQSLTISPQQYSVEFVFNKATAANCIIKLIRQFNQVKGTPQNPRGLMDTQMGNFWKLLQQLFQDVSRLLDEEGMCQRAFSPCFIIGVRKLLNHL